MSHTHYSKNNEKERHENEGKAYNRNRKYKRRYWP
jgi:hypothetical protein